MTRQLRTVPRRRVFHLVGTSGFPNYGDEIITRKWLRLLAKAEPEARVWIDSPNPGSTAAMFQDEHPGMVATDLLYRLCGEAPSDDPLVVREYVQRALSDPGEAPRFTAGIGLLASVDVFHLIGGGYINSIWPRHLGLVAAAEWMAVNTNARVGATGLGILPSSPSVAKVWAEAGPLFDVLTVRDAESHRLLEELGVRSELAPDDAFLGGLASVYSNARDLPEFMVCVQADLHDIPFEVIGAVVRDTLRGWGATPHTTGFVECIPRGDRVIYDMLSDEYGDSSFFTAWDLLNQGFPARAGQKWISSRYHPHMLAAAAGAAGVALEVKPDYYGVKHRALRELGSEWRIASVSDLPGPPGGPGRIGVVAESSARRVLASGRRLYARS